ADKRVVVPCFHDEPLARLRLWLDVYERVGGILYHSPGEQQFAQAGLGLNHPSAVCAGTFLDIQQASDPAEGHRLAGTEGPYVVYCGRYSTQKELRSLVQFAGRFSVERSGRFRFVFVGQGGVRIPAEPWARDLGFLDETAKRGLLAGAAALVQLSCHESLSLVALEAWAQGTPV